MMKQLLLFLAVSLFPFWGEAQSRKIQIAATEWAPFTSLEAPDAGLLSAISRAALKRVGYDAEIVILPWRRAYEMTKKGHYNALLGTSFLEERTADFIYPRHSWLTRHYFHTRVGGREWKYKTLEDLCPATLGLLIGSFHLQSLSKVPCLKIQENSSIRQSVQMLLRGRIDLYLTIPEVIAHYVSKDFPEAQGKIVPIHPYYKEDKVYLVFPKSREQSEALARDYERGMELIKADGSYEAILRKHKMESPKP
jgi:polar amino acid transport system substrate-binding protein